MQIIMVGGPKVLFRDLDPWNLTLPSVVIGGGTSVLFDPPNTRRHKIAGTITVDGEPARRNIMAIDRRTMTYLASTTSDPTTGAWAISGLPELPERTLLVVAMDTTGNYNAEVADYISQVATITV